MALTKIVASRSGHRTTLIPFSGIVDDGSTLSLDFTTGVLDPRLTFTRGSNATFINSSGLVEIAGANMFRNSVLVGGGGLDTPPTSWNNGVAGATYTVANNEVKIETNAGGTARAYMFANYFGSSASGLRYTIQFVVTDRTGSAYRLDELVGLPSNPPVSGTEQWSVNGTSRSSSYTGWVSGDTITYSAVTTGGSSFFPSIGCGIFNALGSTTSVTITRPQMNLGSTASAYYANSSTSAGYHDVPRFDYDPTTIGSPRGLLIEGAANNLISYSEDFSNAAWIKSGTNGSMVLTGTAPDNNATSRLLEENTTSFAKHSLERNISISAGIHTFSVWLKEPSTNSRRYAHIQLADGQATAARYTIVADLQTGTIAASGSNNGTAGAPTGTGHSITAYPGGWYRVAISMNHVASPSYQAIVLGDSASLFGGNNQPFYSATTPYKGLLVWGAQVETGSGASSYIPTGASTGSRVADVCTIGVDAGTATNFSSWWPLNQSQFTVAWTGDLVRNTSTAQFLWLTRNSGGTSLLRVFASSSSGQPLTGFAGNTIPTSVTVNGTPGATLKTALAAQEGDQAVYANNGTVSSSGVAANTGLLFTSVNMNFNPNGDQFMHIKSFKFWPLRLPNATLEALVS